jgi:quinol monooxygenase YgiN
MPAEIIYVDHFRVHEGKTEDFKRYASEMAEFVEENEPGVTSFNYYLDDSGLDGTAVFTFSDAEALDHHLDLVSSRFQEGYELLSAADIELLGRPSDRAIEMGKAFNAIVKHRVGGFSRKGQGPALI